MKKEIENTQNLSSEDLKAIKEMTHDIGELTLDIVKELNSGCELETAIEIIEGQGHSNISFGLICSMVKYLCEIDSAFASCVQS